jgi:molybdopterin synthase sulfur carrier subunit
MITVWVPALLRDLTDGQDMVVLQAETVAQLVERLEERYPGMRARLLHDGRVRPGLAVVIDGEVSRQGLRQRLTPGSEVHFLPALSGGAWSIHTSNVS